MMSSRILTAFAALLFTLFLAAPASAQNSNKSKSKDRFVERRDSVKQPPELIKLSKPDFILPNDPDNAVKLRNASQINSPGMDFSPTFYREDGIVFASARQKNGPVAPTTGETYYELYFAPFDINLEPASPHRFSLEINSSYHEGPSTFSRNGKEMLFTRNNMYKGVPRAGRDGKVGLKIYGAKRGPIDWEGIYELPFNNDDYSCKHPTLSADGKTLYFASDMPGGQGGFDLYICERQGSTWSAPRNLGADVNTKKDEVYPFIHEAGTLFFSSNGRIGIGGFDIFFLSKAEDGSTEIVNMGSEFNSKSNDRGFVLYADGTRGLLCSDREGGRGKDDIYAFTIEKGIRKVRKPTSRPVRFQITDANTGSPLRGASIRILQPSAQGGFVSKNKKNVYELDLAPIQDQSNTLIFELKRRDAEDLGAPDDYSNAAGESRANLFPFRSYLVLVSLDGYGTSERLFTMEDGDDGTIKITLRDAPACHRASGIISTDVMGTRIANAQIRFTHKVSGQQASVRTNLNGQYDVCLPQVGDYVAKVEREGFKPETFQVQAAVSKIPFNEVKLRATNPLGDDSQPLAGALRTGSIMVMDKIAFERGEQKLNQSAVRHLDALFDLMQRYPAMEIELLAHTDTRGEAKNNLILSEARAQNAKAYLVYRGIDAKRINAMGKGETEPRNKCTDNVECSETEHAVNTRFEVKVKRMGA